LSGVLNDASLNIAGNLIACYGKVDSFPVSIESNNSVVVRHTIAKTLIKKETGHHNIERM
jgi:hypothetical protein